MAVIINDMEMPKSCGDCYLRYREGDYYDSVWRCGVTKERICYSDETKYKRDDDCPLKEVPSGKWIPVTERLPKTSNSYLVSGEGEVWICDFLNLMGVMGWGNDAKNPIIEAWQPLPKPYEVEEQTGDNT